MGEMTMVERVARAIAKGLGDDYDHAFKTKSEWNAARGVKGGRSRNINEPMQHDFDDAARTAIAAMREPCHTMEMMGVDHAEWRIMIDAALAEEPRPCG